MAGEGIEVAVGYVSLVPSTRDWDRTVKRELKGKSVEVDVDVEEGAKAAKKTISKNIKEGADEGGKSLKDAVSDGVERGAKEGSKKAKETVQDAVSDGLDKGAKEGGKKAKETIRKSLLDGLDASTAKGLARELKAAGDDASKSLLKSISDGHAEINRRATTAGREYALALQRGTAGGGEAAAKKWEAEFRSALDAKRASQAFYDELNRKGRRGGNDDMFGLRRNLEMFGRSDVLKLNLGAAAITGLPMLAAGLAEVTAGLVQLSQAALVVPGALAGIAASGGTLLLGLSGISDAFDALGKANDDAATSGGDMAATARAQQSASYSLRNAIQDEAQARKDVAQATKDTRRELVDLNIEMRGGVISEKRAILEARKAREELAKGGFRSASDYADAQLRVEEADQRVLEVKARNAETAERLTDSNSKGIANSDLVVAANERLMRSQQQVSTAQAAVADAAPQASAAQEAAALAMGKLSDNGREFVETLRGVVDGPVADLQNLVQDNIFDGLADQLTGLSKKAMPTFEKGLGGIGDAWNDTFTEIMSQFGEDDSLNLLDRIFGNTAEAQTRLNDALDPLIEGVGVLAAAGSDSLPRLADAFVTVSERFSDFITKADSDGRLDKWIDEGITAMGNLGEIALNVGKMFTGIANAADGTLLTNLVEWTDSWQTWLNSVQGQNTLTTIFAEGKAMFEQWKPILEDLPDLFLGLYDAAKLYMDPLLEIVDGVTSTLREYPDLITVAAGAFAVFKGAQVLGAITTLATSLGGINTQLGDPKKGAGGGILGKLGLLGVAGLGVGVAASGGDNAGALSLLGGATVAGAQLGGGPGALAGLGLAGLGIIGNTAVQGFQAQNDAKNALAVPGAPGVPFDPSMILGGGGAAGSNPLDAFAPGANVDDTGGSILPQTQALMDRYKSWGFGDIGGYRQPDGYNEHSSGKAIDVMIPGWDGPGANSGTAVAQDALRQPNTEYVIWRQQIMYPDGRVQQMEDRGSPTQNHFDHVHIKTFDTGGPWKDGQLGINTTGKDEFVLTPQDIEYLRSQGIDPASIQNQALGELPNQNLTPDQQVEQWKSEGLNEAASGRTEGYIPAGAGFTGKTGGGVAGSFINLGGEALKGVIDTAAQAAKMGVAAGTMGTSAAAGPAAGMGIDMAAQAGKRLVDWGTDMANIGVGALSEILLPFGAPRWFSDVDPTAFMPNMTINPAAVTTGEKAFQAVAEQQGLVDPNTTQHGTGAGGAPGPVQPQVPMPPDAGLMNRLAQQTAAAGAPPPQLPPVHIDNITAVDAEDVSYQISRAQNLTMMQYAGRP